MNKYGSLIGFVAFFISAMIAYWILPVGEIKIMLQYFFMLSSLIIAVAGGAYSLYKYGTHGTKANTLLLLTGGMFCWLVGESIWTYYEYYLRIDPFPSLADICYLMAYPLFFLALLRELWLTRINWKTLSKSLIFMIIMSSLLLIGIVLYFGVYLAYQPDEVLLTNSIAISYGIADLVLIVASMLLLILAWEFKGGELSRIWMTLFVSFFLTLSSDILFAVFTKVYNEQGSFYRSLTDSIWILAYMLFAYALFNFGFSIGSAEKTLQRLLKDKPAPKG